MEWLKRWNDALDYIECNLEGKISYDEAAGLACCSTYHFQRMFTYFAGVSLSEYIRRRKMTCAAFALQNGGRVIDVALQFGYDSPTAFNRAFQGVHGLPPSAAQKEGANLRAFSRITLQITVKGAAAMDYRIEKKDAFRIVGYTRTLSKSLEDNFKEVPDFWQEVAQSGGIPKLLPLMNADPKGLLGVSACMDKSAEGEEHWQYFIAVASSLPLSEGMSEYVMPACTWAIFPGKGAMPDSIQELEKRAVTEWLPASGYEYADAPDVELYINADPAHAVFEIWMPVRQMEEKK